MGNGVLLDTNCFSHVFNRNDKQHAEFADFLKWLCYGPGYLVYGGTKYLSELKKTEKYLKVFTLLQLFNKAQLYDSSAIDLEQERIVELVNDPDFDDPHLPAIIIVSKCRVICSIDERSFPFIKRKDIYNGKAKCPKFYTGSKCSNLLKPVFVGLPRIINKSHGVALAGKIDDVVI